MAKHIVINCDCCHEQINKSKEYFYRGRLKLRFKIWKQYDKAFKRIYVCDTCWDTIGQVVRDARNEKTQ